MPTPPRNPYIAGKALNDARGFFGREDVFRLVETVLSSPDQNSIVLFGQRRIGKTSILQNLHSRLPSPPFVSVYFDLMDRARKSIGEVLYELALAVSTKFTLPLPPKAGFVANEWYFKDVFLPSLYRKIDKDLRPVFLFDEFDVLSSAEESELSEQIAAQRFFPYLRQLMDADPRLAFVFALGRKTDDLSPKFKSLFKSSRYHRISVLSQEAAIDLILTAQKNGLLHLTETAIQRIVRLTTGHPYMVQLLCQLIFEKAYAKDGNSDIVPHVDLQDVELAASDLLVAGQNVFDWIWDGLPPAERVIFSALAEGTKEDSIVSERKLRDTLQSGGVRVLLRELQLAPKTLIDWDMLRETDQGYQFYVEVIRRWVVKNKPLAKVHDELDRINPHANNLYQVANTYSQRLEYDNAIPLLEEALRTNPSHLRAHLLLGELYRSKGRLDNAIDILEAAYKQNEDESRIPLEGVLLQRGDSYRNQGRLDAALTDYRHAAQISPDSIPVHEGIGATEEAIRQQKVRVLVEEIVSFEKKEDWNSAISNYGKLIRLDNRNALQWSNGIEKARRFLRTGQIYQKGRLAEQSRQWNKAKVFYTQVGLLVANYKDLGDRVRNVNRWIRTIVWLKIDSLALLVFALTLFLLHQFGIGTSADWTTLFFLPPSVFALTGVIAGVDILLQQSPRFIYWRRVLLVGVFVYPVVIAIGLVMLKVNESLLSLETSLRAIELFTSPLLLVNLCGTTWLIVERLPNFQWQRLLGLVFVGIFLATTWFTIQNNMIASAVIITAFFVGLDVFVLLAVLLWTAVLVVNCSQSTQWHYAFFLLAALFGLATILLFSRTDILKTIVFTLIIVILSLIFRQGYSRIKSVRIDSRSSGWLALLSMAYHGLVFGLIGLCTYLTFPLLFPQVLVMLRGWLPSVLFIGMGTILFSNKK
jgi:tetratricopeptide (TPR) repeat protein